MSVEQVTDKGVVLALLKSTEAHPDLRGQVTETYRESWFPDMPPIKQLVQSQSKANTLRGMHLHRRQWDCWRFTATADTTGWLDYSASMLVTVRLYDPTTGAQQFVSCRGKEVLAIPPGIAHGFYAPAGCTLVYALTEEYTGDDEFGFFPFDGLDGSEGESWPSSHEDIRISMRDLRAPRLADFAA